MKLCHVALLGLVCGTCCWGCSSPTAPADGTPPVPTAEALSESSPPSIIGAYRVKFETTQGDILVEVYPDWAPQGASRFRDLVKAGFYDDVAFFRVLSGFVAQFGINGNPQVQAKWRNASIPDDPVKNSNTRGTLCFATSGPDSRTTQLFINLGNNATLDGRGFSPFAKVIEGMDVVEKLYGAYGEGAPNGPGPDQSRIQQEGNAYLREKFPKLDYVKKATVVAKEDTQKSAAPTESAESAKPAG